MNRLVTIFQFYLKEHLKAIINTVKSEIISQLDILNEINDEFEKLVKEREIIVKLEVGNNGFSPCQISPDGILYIDSRGNEYPPLKIQAFNYRIQEPGTEELPRIMEIFEGMAEKQGVITPRDNQSDLNPAETIVVNKNSSVSVELSVLQDIEKLPLIDLVKEGHVTCSVHLKVTSKRFHNWIKSNPLNMGKKSDIEIEKKMNELFNNKK